MNTRHSLPRCLLLCLLLAWTAGSLAPGSAAGAASREANGFSTWVWNPWLLRSSPDELLRFAAANGVKTLYVQIDPELAAADYAAFIRRASAQRIEVHALDGAPAWATDRRLPEAFLSWLTGYQNSADMDERFSGIHIDVEPYLLPEWTTGREALLQSWKTHMNVVLAGARRLRLSAEADIPFWFHEQALPGETSTLSAWIIDRFDGVTIMAYRDSAEAIVEAARAELAEGEQLGKPVRIAVETNRSAETPKVTFYEEGPETLNAQLESARRTLKQSPAFAGFDVHDYEGWKTLLSKPSASQLAAKPAAKKPVAKKK
ncbi:hypothetical protein [Saccharibacillus brassicae]|uniref:Amidase n=1 Tax=Saccharibacillus brassicae TaxID=2583377 RepID=A0A4Y6UVV7_SACBS|nr:hypothetical protein [Saccharibacillus brassicae]QDH20135.1 hypothetical protein FFV09_04240 [Saccharibacillus brassicae]